MLVPSGMAREGFYFEFKKRKSHFKRKKIHEYNSTFKLPDIFAPSRIPVTEGKKTPNTLWNV